MKVFKAFTYKGHEVQVDVSKSGTEVVVDAPGCFQEMSLQLLVSNYDAGAALGKALVNTKLRLLRAEEKKAA